MKMKQWIAVVSGVCAMLSMQMTAFAEADREALKTALVEYEWRNYTLPETRAKGIENNADLAWIYTSLDEFFNDYCEDNVLSDPLSLIDVDSDYSVRNFFDDWTDFLDDWMEEKEELYGEFSVADAGDSFQIVDAAGNAVEAFDKLYQYMYLNDEMSEEDKEFYLNENGGMSEDYNSGIIDGDANSVDGNTYNDGLGNVDDAANNAAETTVNSNHGNNTAADNANVNDGNAAAYAFSETTEETTEAPTEATEETEKGSAVPYVVGGVIVVVAVGAGGYFFYKKKKGV
ncbi:hypothetical protein [Ruminococcus sp.]|uniref:hypothetical protein n=1 Tax=Ruminococcus sp. TaxID=41978 RepID=UPI0025CC2004|nr:hypothetical protein [Ruminococcus sp.]